MRWIGVIRILAILFTLLLTWYFAEQLFSSKWESSALQKLFDNVMDDQKIQKKEVKKEVKKCGLEKECPKNSFAFKIISGAANVIGPYMCLEDKVIMSNARNNIGRGLNFALINASTGTLIKIGHFDMYSGDIKEVHEFLEPIKDGTLVFAASFDDPATKLDDKARDMFTSYGSSYAKQLGFRDSWAFAGGKGLNDKSPFEQHLKNDQKANKYDGWPEVLEISGCIPRKMD